MKEVRLLRDLESIYRENADTVFRFLMSRTGSADLSEELTQETFYQAIKGIDRYDGIGRISSWLCGIAKNVLYDHFRKERKAQLPEDDISQKETESAEDLAVRNEESSEILKAIEAYPDPGKEVLRLRIFGGLSFKQIGALFDRTENWARVTFYRAKQSIIKELKQDE